MPRRLARAAVFITTAAVGLAAVPMASANTPLRLGPAGITHIGLHQVSSSSVSGGSLSQSTNWSGYAENGANGAFNSVSTSWVQPKLNCSLSPNGYAAFWDGLDGYSSNTVEQDGTAAYCVRIGNKHNSTYVPEYYGWYETYPNPMYNFGGPVSGGDSMSSTVTAQSPTQFLLTLSDNTKGWNVTTTQVLASPAALSSAEVIAEAPSTQSGVLPLADFGTMSFTNSLINGDALAASQNPTEIEMVSRNGALEALPTALSGSDFSVTWKSA